MPSIDDLNSLLSQLRERHAIVFYALTILAALGILGIVCLMGTLVGRNQ
jgi:hypothetical protein